MRTPRKIVEKLHGGIIGGVLGINSPETTREIVSGILRRIIIGTSEGNAAETRKEMINGTKREITTGRMSRKLLREFLLPKVLLEVFSKFLL